MSILKSLRKIGFSKLTLLDEALKILDSYITPASLDEVETSKALNRVLGTDIISELDIPPFDRSAMDGYAVKAEDTFGASPSNPRVIKKIGTVEIGEQTDLVLKSGDAIRISTGAVIPQGADSVIKIEDTDIDGDKVSLYTSIVPGKNISKKGEDIPQGTDILRAGITVKASPNKIYNSNSPMVSSLVETYGGSVVRELTIKDNKDEIRNNLIKSYVDSQIIIFTGGTSVGTKDFLPEIIHENGEVLVHGIAMRPGSPALIGLKDQSLVFCLPGTPVAAYICFLTIVGTTIKKMLGCVKTDPRVEIIATISKDVPVSRMGYKHFLRVKLEKRENQLLALPVKLKGSGIISSLTQSDGIVEISEDREGLKKGEKVSVFLHP
ncbi:MAG: molybdopterin molybdotransferase MoeA [Promethearchaeota archaeon]